jgi:hypothetical protein
MARINFKTALTAAQIPFTYADAPSGVIVPRMDAASRVSGAFSGSQSGVDYNVVEISYAQNVLPTQKGYNSVGFATAIPAYIDGSFT